MPELIPARTLKGFPDYLPRSELARKALIRKIEKSFELYGFVPIDTPALEYAEILLGKGSGETDKQMYRFKDNGDRDVALRFDLTVPFARFMAMHVEELGLPFRRYHIGKVWRGENTQRGRYREFMQCDFDIVGTKSLTADLDIVLCIAQTLSSLEVGSFTIHINHRGLFNFFLGKIGIQDRLVEILRLVDKLDKIGSDAVVAELANIVEPESARSILDFISITGSWQEIKNKLITLVGEECPPLLLVDELMNYISDCLKNDTVIKCQFDPSITRGLDYYTGFVFETKLDTMPEIGSVCSGGRYDELANLYTNKSIPGVGASIGIDRLLAALEAQATKLDYEVTQVLVLNSGVAQTATCVDILQKLRAAGISCELYTDDKKMINQFAYAEKKNIPFAILFEANKNASGQFVLKNLRNRENTSFNSIEDLLKSLNDVLTSV